ncbi:MULTISPECIES: lipopolysaccharide assembly protein LapA domain-containing protein [unclassified Pseudomonas]|uniref:lipopolysaccharide assembly protein LapA domain-containing protein n=1 Tax=unclassified Pseudomonas TaxID=196821 RepID=UPI000A1E16FE|nr:MULTISPECIES: lipopolysaccharide assembly protein LapA domain-containing protein [unclassified Pseudomonas]
MRNFKRVGFFVFFLLLILMLLAFVLENQQSVSLLFLGWAGPQLPVSLIVVLALLVGMILGPLIRGILRLVPRGSRKRPV